jgi:hypothetical protein
MTAIGCSESPTRLAIGLLGQLLIEMIEAMSKEPGGLVGTMLKLGRASVYRVLSSQSLGAEVEGTAGCDASTR